MTTNDELRKLAEAATPRPWNYCNSDNKDGGCKCGFINSEHYPVATATIGPWGDTYPAIRLLPGTGSIERKYEAYTERIDYGEVSKEQGKANARYIAAACNEVPRLLHEIAGLEDEVEELSTEFNQRGNQLAIARKALEEIDEIGCGDCYYDKKCPHETAREALKQLG